MGGRDCWHPFFPFWGLTTGALWEGALKSIPLHKGPFWMGIPWILPASPPLHPKLPWPLHDGSATLEFCVSGQSPAREDQRCAHREDMRLSRCALRLLYPQRGHCSLRSCRGLYRADRQKTHPAFWFVSESWRINNSLRCQSLSAKIWILKWNLRATTATVVG